MCFRCSCFGLRYKDLFQSFDQLDRMLEKKFNGRHFMVPSSDGVELDSMFIPFDDDKVYTAQELVNIPYKN